MTTSDETTHLLNRLGRGERSAADALLPIIYDELRTLAVRYMKHERLDHTLQPTALVHEAYLRLVNSDRIEWRGRSEFLALAAQQIRRVLVDHARGRNRTKRGGGTEMVVFDEKLHEVPSENLDMVALDDALTELGKRSIRQARVVELRFFAGMGVEQVAEHLGVSPRTVRGDWRTARAWLAGQLRD